MIIGSVCEDKNTEKRISVTPENVKKFISNGFKVYLEKNYGCLLYTSPSPRDATLSRMPSSA